MKWFIKKKGFENFKMKITDYTAHKLVEQFIEWNKTDNCLVKSFPSVVPFIDLLHRGNEEKQTKKSFLEPWFNSEIALEVNELLSVLKFRRPVDFDMLLEYYFSGQSLMLTAQRLRIHRTKLKTFVNSALAFIDGMLAAMSKSP